jgi:hypothetical protein
MKPRLILAFPRSGTKLLSAVHEAAGYRVYGEFFNTYSTEIAQNVARRLSPQIQRRRRNLKKELGANQFNYMHTIQTADRCSLYKDLLLQSNESSVVTAWYATFEIVPTAMEFLNSHEILCLKRKNLFEQLLSRLVTIKNLNHDGEILSEPIEVESSTLEYYYYYLRKTLALQEYCVQRGSGTWVDFDELIAGKSDLGFDYSVNTVDQHIDLRAVVKNYEQAHDFFIEIKTRYGRYDDIEFKEEK